MIDDHHPNARGHDLVFQQVADAITARDKAEDYINERR
jgi:hypothetical protein